jgi:EmrB/QacA subfamily drug resistance transporter
VENEPQRTHQQDLPRRQVMTALIGTMASMFLGSIFMTVTTTAMPRIITDLGGFSQYTWVFTAYIIAETVSLPLTGKLSDMYGRKWLFIGGMALFTLGALLSGFSHTMNELIVYRVVQGFGFGAMSALGFIVIGDLFPPEERGKYSGIMAGVFGFSSVIGPTIGGILTDALSWRWCFFMAVPIGVIIVLLFIFMFPDFRIGGTRHKVDYAGVVFLSLFLVPLMLALNWGGAQYPWGSAIIIGLIVFSLAAFWVFVLVERRAPEAIIPMALFKNRVVLVSSIVAFLQGAAFFPVVTFIPLFFQGVLGASATESGGFMTPMMLGMALGSFVGGQALSRTGGHYRAQGAIGFTIAAVGFLLLARMTPATTFLAASVFIAITGFGNGNIMPIHTIAVQNTVPYEVMGTATSLISLLRPVGGALGLAVVGSVLNNQFAATFLASLPASVTSVVSPAELQSLINNPQALVSPEAQVALHNMFVGVAGGESIFTELLTMLRNALSSSLATIFMVFFIATVMGLVANFFLKGVPPYQPKAGKLDRATG